MFKYGVITDEISQDIYEACALAHRYNLNGIEIRSVNERGPHEFTDEDVAQIKDAMKKYSLECCAISSPVFKCNLNDDEVKKNIKILEKCISVAKSLGTKYIRSFTFFKEEDSDDIIDKIVNVYKGLESLLESEDVYLLLEFDPSVYASCGQTLAKVIRAINMDRVKGLWDPGNDIYSPEKEIPYPDGYEYMKGLITHVHIKDAKVNDDGTIAGVAFGDGEVDFKGQLIALKDDGYDGYLVMETHYRVKKDIPEELLTMPKGSMFSLGGYEATEECFENFFKMIKEI